MSLRKQTFPLPRIYWGKVMNSAMSLMNPNSATLKNTTQGLVSVCLGTENREVKRPQGITDARKIV